MKILVRPPRVSRATLDRLGMVRIEDEDVHRIHFDSTLDEVVDASIRLTTRTQSVRAYRSRAIWVAGGCLAVALLGVVFFRSKQGAVDLSATSWCILVVLAVTLGTGFGYAYGLYLNWAMRRQHRRVVSEQLGGVADVPCDIELRQGGVWVLQNGLEMMFPWANSVGIEDTGDAIELRFRPGLVVARNRAFHDAIDRTRFLDRARTLVTKCKTLQ